MGQVARQTVRKIDHRVDDFLFDKAASGLNPGNRDREPGPQFRRGFRPGLPDVDGGGARTE